MARSNYGIINLEPMCKVTSKVKAVLSESGFEPILYDGEEVWAKENVEMNLIGYIKTDYEVDVFICSAWVSSRMIIPIVSTVLKIILRMQLKQKT